MKYIISLTDITDGLYVCPGAADKASSMFEATYNDGSKQDFHFTVGLNHKTPEQALAACTTYRNLLARQNDVAA